MSPYASKMPKMGSFLGFLKALAEKKKIKITVIHMSIKEGSYNWLNQIDHI